MQNERLLADARSLAMAQLVRETRPLSVFQSEHLEAEPLRLGDIDQRLARVFARVKHAEAVLELCEIHFLDREDLDGA